MKPKAIITNVYDLSDDVYSEPMSDEEVFSMIMSAVRAQLNKSSGMPKDKRRSFIRTAAKDIIGKMQ